MYYTNKYGIQIPATTDELLEAMRAFKKIKPNASPHMSWSGNWFNQMNCMFLGTDPFAFSLGGGSIVYDWDDTKGWKYVVERKGFKEMIQYMATQYREGLIPKDFITMPSDVIDSILYGSGDEWLFYTCWPVPSNFTSMYPEVQAKFPEYACTYITTPRWTGRDSYYIWPNVMEGSGTGGIIVSSKVKSPELLCAALDYLISDEIDTLVHWGIEGETYTVNPDGSRSFVPQAKTASNPNGSLDLARDYGLYPHINYKQLGWITSNKSSWDTMFATDVDMSDLFGISQNEINANAAPKNAVQTMPSPTFTIDEQEEIKEIMVSINTYVGEEVTKFVLGERPMSEFDSFMAVWPKKADYERVKALYAKYPPQPLIN
jgi:putative aldouronate transport system substrate-binding protein